MSYLPDLLTSLANVAGQVQTAINVAIAKLPDGTTTSLSTTGPTAGAISVIGSGAIPALPGPMTSADTFPVLRAGNTYTATPLQVAALLGAAPVAGTGTTPAATPFADVTGASWTIEQIAARVAAINGTPAAPAVPGQVTALTIGTPTSSSLPLTWTAPSTGGAVAAYTVEERLTGGTTFTVCSTSVTTTSYVIPGLVAGTAYDVRVTATNGAGAGPPSAVVSATTAAAAAGPANTVTIKGRDGVAFDTTSPTTLQTYGTTAYGNVSGNSFITLFNVSGGASVPTSTPNVYGAWHTSPTSPPVGLGSKPFGSYPTSNGWDVLTGPDATNFGIGNIGATGTVGTSAAPGTPYYLWVSTDNHVTWSVARDASNVATAIRVIF